jgi:Cu2+-exporting ATPase
MFITGTLIIGGIALIGKRIYDGRSTAKGSDHSPVETFEEEEEEPIFSPQTIDRYLVYSGAAFVLTTATFAYPILAVISRPVIVLTALPLVLGYYEGIVKKKHVASNVLDVGSIVAPIATGYFFMGAVLVGMHYTSQKLLLKTKDLSRKSLQNVFGAHPRTVWLVKDGIEIEVPVESLAQGDVVIVNAGQMIMVDGVVSSGSGLVDQGSLTGESQPVDKMLGDGVFASSMVLSGQLLVRVEKAVHDSVAVQINEILRQSADFNSLVTQKGESLRNRGAAVTLALSALTLPLLGPQSAVVMLYAGFGYSLKYAAPIGTLNYLRTAAQNGILVKDGRALELLAQVDTIVFDKTGTLTEEVPSVGAIYTANGYGRDVVLTLAAAAETNQTHPYALAILRAAQERDLPLPAIDETTIVVGYGLTATIDGQMVRIGSRRFMEMEQIPIDSAYTSIEAASHAEGHSLVFVAIENKLGGMIELHATLRQEVREISAELRRRHIEMIVVSGDHEKPTRKSAQLLNVDSYHAETLPQDKAIIIEQLQATGHTVCFVGDGINDSIALKKANVSISLAGASAIATNTASVLLIDGSLNQLIKLLDIAKQLQTNFSNSVALSVLPGVLCVGGVYLFNLSLIPAIVLYDLGWLATVTNAVSPQLLKRENLPDTTKK